MTSALSLDAVSLSTGSHGRTFRGECCLVECSNRIAAGDILAEGWTPRCDLPAADFQDDHPSISPVIRAFAIGLNDAWKDEDRQRLKPYAPRLLCTKTTPADEEVRAWLAVDWLARVYTPAFLRLAGLEEHARALESLARIADATTCENAQPALQAAREASAAASATASAAVWATASAAVWATASAAAWATASAAVWATARAAAWATASAAAWDRLKPVVEDLQGKALELLDAMVAVGQS